MQVSLFDSGPAAREHAPQYVEVKAWDEKEKLMQEKQAWASSSPAIPTPPAGRVVAFRPA